MENRGGGNKGNGARGEPPPEHDRLRDGVALHAALRLEVKNLELALSCFGRGEIMLRLGGVS